MIFLTQFKVQSEQQRLEAVTAQAAHAARALEDVRAAAEKQKKKHGNTTIPPVDRKMLLSIREAAAYSNIITNKIDELLKQPTVALFSMLAQINL